MSVQAKSFAEIFNSGSWQGMQQFADGTLQTDDGTTFRIHRIILSPRSVYFRALFSSNLNHETIIIHNVDSKILESLLIYVYTGTIALDEENVCDWMTTSRFFLLDELLKSCGSFVIQNTASTKCLPLLTVASQMNRLEILDDCCRYALVFFEDILETSNCGLVGLPVEVLRKLLGSNSLNVVSEKSVWRAVVSWTEANCSARLPHVPLLLTCLRLEEEVTEDLSSEILSHSIVSNNPHIFDLMLNNQFNFHKLKRTILSQYASLKPACSYGTRTPNRLYLIARHTLTPTQYGSRLFLTYDNELDFWRQTGEVYFFIDTMVQIGQRIYMFNIQRGTNAIFDIVEEEWLPTSIPLSPSYNGWVVSLLEKLYSIDEIRGYAIGRRDSRNVISSYEFERNRWESKITTHDIDICGVVTLKDQIYIVGVSKFEPVPIMMCRAYDPEEDTWTLIPPPSIFRREFSIVVFHERLFLIAGVNNDGEHLKDVEVYNPLQNTWMSFPDLPILYCLTRAVVVDDKIIVHENYDEGTRYLEVASPVYWDEGAHLWKIIDESSPWYHTEGYSFLALDNYRLVKDITAKNRLRRNEWKRILPVKLQ
ncbi:Kelch-like protein 17 [Araneus ventricosus]|uniref:Kelch-like protein 17 n=1 Tax=Araneus ventricosus TaxID=182803 RepID=A0A4Y2TSY4_ARAVE|nr:Kelch-like protein 17 [Araneus ventricosus]